MMGKGIKIIKLLSGTWEKNTGKAEIKLPSTVLESVMKKKRKACCFPKMSIRMSL